jgi:hypothetical protein
MVKSIGNCSCFVTFDKQRTPTSNKMIRGKFHKNIVATLDKHSRFDSSDFNIEPTRTSGGILLIIIFAIDPKYKISIKIPNSETSEKDGYRSYYHFTGSVTPGPLAYEETFAFQGEDGIYEKITTWLDCIWDELAANPIVKEVENQRHQIDDLFEKFENLDDGYFTKEEASKLKMRLDNLEETLKGQIQEETENKKAYEEQISKLHMDIDTLKQTINSYNKKGWIKSFTSKVFKWTKSSENRKLLADGYEVIREFLPEDVKSSLP